MKGAYGGSIDGLGEGVGRRGICLQGTDMCGGGACALNSTLSMGFRKRDTMIEALVTYDAMKKMACSRESDKSRLAW